MNRNGTPLAIGGYDAVAYFKLHRAVKGKAAFSFRYNGAIWRFSTAAHRDAFAAAPERFAPQYGGYCAFAMAEGRFVRIDPKAWTLVQGRLYLNYSLDVQETWRKKKTSLIKKADDRWRGVFGAGLRYGSSLRVFAEGNVPPNH